MNSSWETAEENRLNFKLEGLEEIYQWNKLK